MGASNHPGLALRKPDPVWKKKQASVGAERKAMRECYTKVDLRDERKCRVCQKHVGGIGMLQAVHHHHLQYRSKGGAHETSNVLSLCVGCHQAVHDGEIRLSGDADEVRGVKLERAAESGWQVERWL